MAITRRDWLKVTGAVAAATTLPALGACGGGEGDALPNNASRHPTPELERYAHEGPLGPEALFQHGVASGDPLPDAVILWTRVSPATPGDVQVFYEVATDPSFEARVAAGWLVAREAADYTVKHDLTGLLPSSTLYYRFQAVGRVSPTGRLRTAPEGGVGHLRFGVVSCASLAHGYFHVYERLAERPDLEAVLHLGDYIYEYGSAAPEAGAPDERYGTLRAYEPTHEIVSLADYRARYAQYRREPSLQAVHRQHPMIHVWDDHELADNSWSGGAENHDEATEGSFAARKAAAAQAYAEWMPTRQPAPTPLYRKLAYGDLVDFFMLDTRNEGRSEQVRSADEDSDERTLLGFEQERWLEEGLVASRARWKLLGQQVMITPIGLGGLFFDGWEGYPAARERLLRFVEEQELQDVVVLTGDIHTSWANEVARDGEGHYEPETGVGALAVEFVTPAVSSPGLGSNGLVDLVYKQQPMVQFCDHKSNGCIVLDLRRDAVQADWYFVDSVTDPAAGAEHLAKAFAVAAGNPRLVEVLEPAPTRAAPPLAP